MVGANELMTAFRQRGKRYLWTDAFAVCNYLGLGRIDEAVALVDRVHAELGAPLGGLRIGKPLPEGPGWDEDGQYFHYLTKWMHALARVAAVTGEPKYLARARELADTAFHRFVYEVRGRKRMYWKMSIDLSRPLVLSMGHHDPLDGYVTSLELDLPHLAAEYRTMIHAGSLATGDPLGIGGLLVDSHRLAQLDLDRPLRDALIAAARAGLEHYVAQPDLRLSPNHRLAFRELGLAIGLAATGGTPELARFARVRGVIESFWSDDNHRRSATYRDHQDINDVMLATSLAPAGFLADGTRHAA